MAEFRYPNSVAKHHIVPFHIVGGAFGFEHFAGAFVAKIPALHVVYGERQAYGRVFEPFGDAEFEVERQGFAVLLAIDGVIARKLPASIAQRKTKRDTERIVLVVRTYVERNAETLVAFVNRIDGFAGETPL